MRLKTRECLNCGNDITDRVKQARYCSDECRSAPRFRGNFCLICKDRIYTTSKGKTEFCSKRCRFLSKNPDFNEDFFAEPNLENSYWAGFIAADGNVWQPPGRSLVLSIGLQRRDGAHLEELQKSIGAGKLYQIDTFDEKYGKVRERSEYQLYSNKICSDLEMNFNITPKKSLTLEPPELTDDNALAYIAGYIDGDGSYGLSGARPRIYIRGTYDILSWIALAYKQDRRPKLSYGTHYIYFDGEEAIKIRDSFSEKGLPLLDRKRGRWEEMGWSL